jgi:hypothetical protein
MASSGMSFAMRFPRSSYRSITSLYFGILYLHIPIIYRNRRTCPSPLARHVNASLHINYAHFKQKYTIVTSNPAFPLYK